MSRSSCLPRSQAVLSPLAAMLQAAGMGLMLLAVAGAPTPAAAADAAGPGTSAARKSYAIAGGPLGDVLAQFAAAAGVPLSFDPALVAGRQSDGLTGAYTVREGFARLLSGSGYALAEQGAGAYSLRKLPQGEGEAATLLPSITVAGSGVSASALP
ncbi:MAG: STN domain-containing protein, partial [Achromobacter sp.]